MGIEIRRIRVDDWAEYRRLRLEALKDTPLAFVERYDDLVAEPDQFWQDRVTRDATEPASAMFVAVEADRLVGKVGCFIEPEVTSIVSAHVVGVYVPPSHRGGDVAASLMRAAIHWAEQEHQAERIRLYVMDTNDRALAFYRRIGFALTGASIAYPPDPTMTEVEMAYRRAA